MMKNLGESIVQSGQGFVLGLPVLGHIGLLPWSAVESVEPSTGVTPPRLRSSMKCGIWRRSYTLPLLH